MTAAAWSCDRIGSWYVVGNGVEVLVVVVGDEKALEGASLFNRSDVEVVFVDLNSSAEAYWESGRHIPWYTRANS